jgi:peptidoglycan/xylan/chitin deacetylase (PgdA/CDA1 family)
LHWSANSFFDFEQPGSTMTARRALSATVLAFFLTGSAIAAPRKSTTEKKTELDSVPAATVLCYHIVESPAAPRMHIDREVFRNHLRYLEATGYNVIPLRHLYEYVAGKRSSIPKNAVVITIDDGWRSTYTEAFPELQKRKFPFTVFIYPNIIGKTSNALTWEQIKEMSDAGVDIQSHSLTHPYLTKRRHRFDDEQYAKWLYRELAESKRVLEKHTGRTVEFLAYPYGDYDDRVAKTAKRVGYSAALTCDFGKVRPGSDPLKMRRFVIDDRMDFADFRRYLGAVPMQLAEISPSPGKPVPPDARTITAKIPHFESLDPTSVGMALLSLGKTVPYSYDARSGAVKLVLRETIGSLKSKVHRAVVWGNDLKTGKRVEATFVFRIPEPATVPPPPQQPAPSGVAAASMVGGVAPGGSPKR